MRISVVFFLALMSISCDHRDISCCNCNHELDHDPSVKMNVCEREVAHLEYIDELYDALSETLNERDSLQKIIDNYIENDTSR